MIFTNGNKSDRLVEGSLGGVTSTTLRQLFIITALNGNLETAESLGREYRERTYGLEGRL